MFSSADIPICRDLYLKLFDDAIDSWSLKFEYDPINDHMTIILGTDCAAGGQPELDANLSAVPRFTYRHSMSRLPYTQRRSDQHWGCCIRCAQGLLAQFILKYAQSDPRNFAASFPAFKDQILGLFYDLEPSRAPLGIHAFCAAVYELTHKTGECIKTSIMAMVIQLLLRQLDLTVVVSENGLISKPPLNAELAKGKPVLVLIPLMLSPTKLNNDYEVFLKVAISLKDQTIGIIGGQKGKAFFIIGYHEDTLLFFDPHILLDPVIRKSDEERLFVPQLKRMPIAGLNSSMLVGFFVRTTEDLEDITAIARPLTKCPFAITEQSPCAAIVADEGDWGIVG
jgi:cysteine protease ATG4